MEVDHLTLAYVAIGAHDAIDDCLPYSVSAHYGGQLGYINAVINHVPMLDNLSNLQEDEQWDGCYAYEVAEEFGRRVGDAYIKGKDINERAVALELINACRVKI